MPSCATPSAAAGDIFAFCGVFFAPALAGVSVCAAGNPTRPRTCWCTLNRLACVAHSYGKAIPPPKAVFKPVDNPLAFKPQVPQKGLTATLRMSAPGSSYGRTSGSPTLHHSHARSAIFLSHLWCGVVFCFVFFLLSFDGLVPRKEKAAPARPVFQPVIPPRKRAEVLLNTIPSSRCVTGCFYFYF
jgi:hypothetical protein